MQETLHHREAFERYYAMGSGRSLASLAQHCDVTERTLKRWSKAFSWQERIEQRDMENARRLEKKTDDTIVNEKANYRKIIKAAIGTFVNNLKAQKVDVLTVQDVERLVKLDLLLMGEATERTDDVIRVTLPEDMAGGEDDGDSTGEADNG